MSTPQIAPIIPPYDAETADMLKKWMPPNAAQEPLLLFRVLARHPDLMSRMRPLGAGLLGSSSSLRRDERELVINRVCAQRNCEYEWGVHVAAFGPALLTPEKCAMTRTAPPDDPRWSTRESLLMALVDHLHARAQVPAEMWEALRREWDETQMLEWLVLIGWYHTIAFVANVSGIPLEPWGARFPVPEA